MYVDALNHIGYGGTIFNGFTEAEHLGSRHWHRAGADRHPPVITRGVLLDVAALHGVDELPPSHAIGPADLEELGAAGVHEFAFIGACLKIRGATGSPIRPLALPLRS